jgi:glyoxylase-like metal-dependent hydrolase (beta-lactamase superfamily II)
MGMREIRVGDVTINSIVEREGPWRKPEIMFPAFDPVIGHRHLAELDPIVFDAARGLVMSTYQTFVVRTPKHTILIDTCTGEDKGYPPPMDFPKKPWLDGFHALGLTFDAIDYVLCTHLHVDHTGWNTRMENGRWVPTFPRAKYIFHRREYEFWEKNAQAPSQPAHSPAIWLQNCRPIVEAGRAELVDENFSLDDTVFLAAAPGHSPHHCCVHIRSRGQEAIVSGDLMHHALQCREPDWSTIFCWDPAMAAQTRRRFLRNYAGTRTLVMPIHFPAPTAGRIEPDGERFHYRFAYDG